MKYDLYQEGRPTTVATVYFLNLSIIEKTNANDTI